MSAYDTPEEPEHTDTEITLGLRSILGIFFGLVLICGVFFGLGYSLGRGNAVKPSAALQPASQAAAPASSSLNTVVEQPSSSTATPASTDPYRYSTGSSSPAKPSGAVAQSVAPSTAAQESVVATRPSSSTSGAAGPHQSTSASDPTASPAKSAPAATTAQQSPVMVQIAAISRPQDADVLIAALEKRGFHASARREASDNLLHIQIGPFATRQQAMAMRTRLLDDGYNAILK